MKINSNTSYPYPIWGWKDDYKSTINDEDILITEISDKDNFVYELELLAKNEDVERLIEQGKAIYACVGYLSFYVPALLLSKREFKIHD